MKLGTLPDGAKIMSKKEYEETALPETVDKRNVVIKKMIARNKLTLEKMDMMRAYNRQIFALDAEISDILKDIETNQLDIFKKN